MTVASFGDSHINRSVRFRRDYSTGNGHPESLVELGLLFQIGGREDDVSTAQRRRTNLLSKHLIMEAMAKTNGNEV